MDFDLISDFHVEMNKMASPQMFYDWKKEQTSDVLVIAGDSGNDVQMSTAVIMEAARTYKHVVCVDGNHEHYGWGSDGNTDVVVQKMKKFFDTYCKNVKLLHGKNDFRIQKDDKSWTAIIGCNGWYDFQYGSDPTELQRMAWMRYSNDMRIKFYDEPQNLARYAARNLQNKIDVLNEKNAVTEIVVVTHTSPIKDSLKYNPGQVDWNRLNGAYGNSHMANVAFNPTAKKIKVWVFGHTHYSFDEEISGIRFVANPRGYSGESRDGKLFEGLKNICVPGTFPNN